jgi:hypothetical protein
MKDDGANAIPWTDAEENRGFAPPARRTPLSLLPWELVHEQRPGIEPSERWSIQQGGIVLAETCWIPEGAFYREQVREAVIKMTAALDLLVACKVALPIVLREMYSDAADQGVVNDLRAAITKAEAGQ